MGKNAQRRRQLPAPVGQTPPPGPQAAPSRWRHARPALLGGIPVLTLGAAITLATVGESRAGAGFVGLLGVMMWVAAFAGVVGERVPRRDHIGASGIGFGRKQG